MSFVKRAVKKVFKVVKRATKKAVGFLKRAWDNPWVRTAVIVGASLFAGGFFANGGWKGFTTAIKNAGGGVTGFFKATGSTIASGYNELVQSVKGIGEKVFGPPTSQGATQGAQHFAAGGLEGANDAGAIWGEAIHNGMTSTPDMAAAYAANQAGGGLTGLGNEGISQALASEAMSASNPYKALTSLYQPSQNPAPTGFWGKLGNLLTDPGWGGTFLRQGIANGVMSWYAQKDQERQEWYWKNRTVWGGPAFGGTAESNIDMPAPVNVSPQDMYAQQQQQNSNAGSMAMQGSQQSVPAMQGQQQPGLLQQDPQMVAQAQAQAANGIPAQNTQPPPATQPPQGRPPGLLQLESMGVA